MTCFLVGDQAVEGSAHLGREDWKPWSPEVPVPTPMGNPRQGVPGLPSFHPQLPQGAGSQERTFQVVAGNCSEKLHPTSINHRFLLGAGQLPTGLCIFLESHSTHWRSFLSLLCSQVSLASCCLPRGHSDRTTLLAPTHLPTPLRHCPPPRWAWAEVTRARRTPAGRESKQSCSRIQARNSSHSSFLGCQFLHICQFLSLVLRFFLNPHSVNTHDFHTCTNTHSRLTQKLHSSSADSSLLGRNAPRHTSPSPPQPSLPPTPPWQADALG